MGRRSPASASSRCPRFKRREIQTRRDHRARPRAYSSVVVRLTQPNARVPVSRSILPDCLRVIRLYAPQRRVWVRVAGTHRKNLDEEPQCGIRGQNQGNEPEGRANSEPREAKHVEHAPLITGAARSASGDRTPVQFGSAVRMRNAAPKPAPCSTLEHPPALIRQKSPGRSHPAGRVRLSSRLLASGTGSPPPP